MRSLHKSVVATLNGSNVPRPLLSVLSHNIRAWPGDSACLLYAHGALSGTKCLGTQTRGGLEVFHCDRCIAPSVLILVPPSP